MYFNKKLFIFISLLVFLLSPFKFTFGANPGDVVINEVMWAGNEWIELYNTTNQDIEMENWKIDNAKSGGNSLENINGPIPANGYFLICDQEYVGEVRCNFSTVGLSLADGTYRQLILKENDILIDQTPEAVKNKWPAGKKAGSGDQTKYYSMERVNPKISGSEQCNWETAKEEDKYKFVIDNKSYYGTPKAQNSQFSTEAPAPLSANAGDNIISTTGTEITFDASGSTGNIEEYYWNFGDGKTATGKIVTHKYQYPGNYYVSLKVSSGEKGDDSFKEDEALIEVQIFSSQIFISEFLPNPKGNDSGNEWIEIVNESNEIQDISGWGIGNKGDKANFILPEGTYLAPKSLLLLSSSLTKISLSNNSGSVFLFYPSGEVSQEVKYEKPGEEIAIARENGTYFYTKAPTPGMKNIISNSSLFLSNNTSFQSQNSSSVSSLNSNSIFNPSSTSTSSNNANSASSLNSSSAPTSSNNTNSALPFNSSSASTSSNNAANSASPLNSSSSNQISSEVKEENPLPTSLLSANLLANARANQKNLLLAILGVSFCSGFLAIGLVQLRRKLKNKNKLLNNSNLEKIEVEIEK